MRPLTQAVLASLVILALGWAIAVSAPRPRPVRQRLTADYCWIVDKGGVPCRDIEPYEFPL